MRYEVPMLNVITTSLLLGFQKTKQYQLQYLLVVTCYCHSCSGNEYGLCLNGLRNPVHQQIYVLVLNTIINLYIGLMNFTFIQEEEEETNH